MVHDGIARVDVPAAGQVHLCAAVDDLPVGIVGTLRFAGDGGGWIAVEQQMAVLREFEQFRQEPGVAPAGQDQIGIVHAQDRIEVGQESPDRFERLAIAAAFVGEDDPFWLSMGRVAIRFQPQEAQGWVFGIQVPG